MRVEAREALRSYNVLIIFCWFCANIGVLVLNKLLLSTYGFKFPVFLTAVHMFTAAVLSKVLTAGFAFAPREHLKSRKQVFTLSGIFCVSVVTGNISLRFISVSFNQAVGATTPLFTAFFSLLIIRKRETPLTYLALVPIVVGTALASGYEPGFSRHGFVMCLTAAAARALKSVLQELLLLDGEALHPLSLLGYMAPMALALLIPGTLLIEGNVARIALEMGFVQPRFLMLLGLNCVVAYVANLSNFLVTKATGALTLQVLGKAKGVIAVVLSLLIFRNRVKPLGMAGYSLCVVGVFCYSEAKRRGQKAALLHARDRGHGPASVAVDIAGGGLGAVGAPSPARDKRSLDGRAPAEYVTKATLLDVSGVAADAALHVRHTASSVVPRAKQ